jgi:hypothetical protein
MGNKQAVLPLDINNFLLHIRGARENLIQLSD